MNNSLRDDLLHFPSFEKEEWIKRARQELKGMDPEQLFSWSHEPEIPLEAYYDAKNLPQDRDSEQLQGLADHLEESAGPSVRSLFYLSPLHSSEAEAYTSLSGSQRCDAILYDLGEIIEDSPPRLLRNIQSQNIHIGYRFCANNSQQKEAFRELLSSAVWPFASMMWEARSMAFPLLSSPSFSLDNTAFQALGAPPSLQIAHLLSAMSACLRAGLERGEALEEILKKLIIWQAAEVDYYHEIAKLRALRLCMGRVAFAFGAKEPWASRFRIVGTTNPRYRTFLEPSMNMLRHTTQALSLEIGGVSDLLILPHLDPGLAKESIDAARGALNIAQILGLETDIGKLADPVSGAYFFEYLTDQLARKAWKGFQEIEAEGGLEAPALQQKLLQAGKEADQLRREEINSARQRIIGLNTYVEATATPTVPPLSSRSDLYLFAFPSIFGGYEELRRSSDAFFSQHQLPRLQMLIHEGLPHAEVMKRYWQDSCAVIGISCPESWFSPMEPLAEAPSVLIAVLPDNPNEGQCRDLRKLFVEQAKRGGPSYLGGSSMELPLSLAGLKRLHYFSFPQEASLSGWKRLQRTLFHEIS